MRGAPMGGKELLFVGLLATLVLLRLTYLVRR